MKNRFALILALFLIVACGKNVRDACHSEGDFLVCPKDGTRAPISVPGPAGGDGTNGLDGSDSESCSVTDTEEGAEITCPDGSSVEIFDGEDGSVVVCHKKHDKRICVKKEKEESYE